MKAKMVLKKMLLRITLFLLLVNILPQEMYSVEKSPECLSSVSVIVLGDGQWSTGAQTRSGPIMPTASINGATLIIENPSKNCDFTINIIDNEGYTVYEQTVPAAATAYIAIPLGGFPSGTYTLSLRNPSGGYLHGYFTIN